MVEPRWLRARRREAARAAARRDALLDRLLRQTASSRHGAPDKTYAELMEEQGIKPLDWAQVRRESGLTDEDWEELRAALRGEVG